jgi:hypothetical protein
MGYISLSTSANQLKQWIYPYPIPEIENGVRMGQDGVSLTGVHFPGFRSPKPFY